MLLYVLCVLNYSAVFVFRLIKKMNHMNEDNNNKNNKIIDLLIYYIKSEAKTTKKKVGVPVHINCKY